MSSLLTHPAYQFLSRTAYRVRLSALLTAKAIVQRHCTPFLTAAVTAGGLAVATSTLAPAVRKPVRKPVL
jgi:hypothetical protein